MGAFDKILNLMKLNSEDDDDDELYDLPYSDAKEEPAPKAPEKPVRESYKSEEPAMVSKPKANKITPIRSSKKNAVDKDTEVCVIKPETFEDAREAAETLLANHTVVLNMEGLDVDVAQRIIDFTSGACFAINGNLRKISNYIFILTPETVDLSGDFQGIIDGFDFSTF